LRCKRRQMEKMPDAQPMPPLRMVSDSRERSRLKITPDVAAMLESPVGPAKNEPFVLIDSRRVEIDDGRRETWSS
jgi:hypothetical protein